MKNIIAIIIIVACNNFLHGQSIARLHASLESNVLKIAKKHCYDVEEESVQFEVLSEDKNSSSGKYEIYTKISWRGNPCMLCNWDDCYVKGILSFSSDSEIKFERTYENPCAAWNTSVKKMEGVAVPKIIYLMSK